MYVIRHTKNKNYYKSNIEKNINHYVIEIKDAKKFKNKYKAKEILKTFKHPENYELIKINNNGEII